MFCAGVKSNAEGCYDYSTHADTLKMDEAGGAHHKGWHRLTKLHVSLCSSS